MAGHNFSQSSTVPWLVHVLWLYIAICYVGCLSILEHLVDPLVAPNCSTVTLICRVDAGASAANVWWTYRGENASKLPDVTIITDEAENGEWKLELKCPTLEHRGSYACNVQGRNQSEIVHRKEAVVKIFVPVTIEGGHNMSSEEAGGKANLTCRVTAYPLATIKWLKGGDPVNITDGRLQSTTYDVDGVTVLASLLVTDLERGDSGTYICQASNEFSNSSATQDITVQVQFLNERETEEDPSAITPKWNVSPHRNLTVVRSLLRKASFLKPAETVADENIPLNLTSYTVNGLSGGLSYNSELSAVNKAANSQWESINISLPAGVPPKVSWVYALASTNETLLFGWRRPAHDNGPNITHYNVHLWHNGDLVENKTIDIQASGRENHMYIFLALQSGEIYNFQVQACNSFGCGNWSEPIDGTTSDGIPDPPRNVEVRCEHDHEKDTDSILITWDVPLNARGTISHYNISIFSRVRIRNDNGQYVEEKVTNTELVDAKSNKLEYTTKIQPNTEYTVQICTINRAGCGPMTNVTANTQCMSLVKVPPKVSWVRVLASTNETLLFGWRRPAHDNGEIITHYNVHLWHNGDLVENKRMGIQPSGRNNHMYIFAALKSGETYSFQVQACNSHGCGNWSEPVNGITEDGIPDPPRNVEVKCEHGYEKDTDNILITWDVPLNARGTISHYKITIFSKTRFRNDNGQQVKEKVANIEHVDVKSNKLEYTTERRPNTEYTVQMCTVNRAGCGPMTSVTANMQCMSLANGATEQIN